MSDGYTPPYPPASRREMLGVAAALAGLATIPTLPFEWPRIARMWHGPDLRRQVLERVSDLLIPAGDTPGAAATGVPQFVQLALRHGLDGTRVSAGSAAIYGGEQDEDAGEPESARHLLKPLKHALDAATPGGDFLLAPPPAQQAALEAVDADAFKPGNDDHPWHKVKDLILLGYYTSQVGGSQELRYELVPGRFDPDVPVTADTRAFSSDWTAVEFG